MVFLKQLQKFFDDNPQLRPIEKEIIRECKENSDDERIGSALVHKLLNEIAPRFFEKVETDDEYLRIGCEEILKRQKRRREQ